MARPWLSVACAAALWAGEARGDTVTLSTGGRLEGKAQVLPNGSVRIELADGAAMTLSSDQVKDIEYGPTSREVCDAKRKELAAGDARGRSMLAAWCIERGLKKEAEVLYREVVAIDPDNETARKALGHVRDGTEWVTASEFHRRRGEELFDGRWVTPQEKARLVKEREARELRIYLGRLVDRAAGTGEPAARAERELFALPPADIVVALLEGLKRSSKTRLFAARELRAVSLSGKEKIAAVQGLIRIVLTGSTKELREAGVRALEAIDYPDTAIVLCRSLYDPEPLQRIFALQALLYFPDPRAVRYLLESFGVMWQGAKSAGLLTGVSSSYIRGYELTLGAAGGSVVVGGPETSAIQVGTGVGGAVEESSEDRMRKAEAYLRSLVLETFTGHALGYDSRRWLAWWNEGGKAEIEAKIAVERQDREAREKAKEEEKTAKEPKDAAPAGVIEPKPPEAPAG